jgi:uncharacterized protein YggE
MDQLPNISSDPQPDSRTPDPSRNRAGIVTTGRALAVTAAAALVVGLVVGPIISGHPTLAADPTTSPVEHTVTVSGSGAVSVAPDVADVVLGVQITKPTVAEAQSAAATAMSAVIAAIKKDGVDAKDIVTVNLSLSPVYDYNSSPAKLTGQQFVNVVKVTVHDINRIAAIVDDAVSAGATTIQGIVFRVDNPKNVATQARQIAMQDARAKADALASSAGVSVKGVASITETSSSTPIYYPSATMDKALASTPIQTGTTDVIVNVTVSYLIG